MKIRFLLLTVIAFLLFSPNPAVSETIGATAGKFNGWVLDFDNDANNEQIGSWTSSRNLVLTRPRDNGAIPDGAKWAIKNAGSGKWVITATAGKFNGWVLDFDNDANNEQIGTWKSSRNLIITRPRNGAVPDGAKWAIKKVGNGKWVIVATAGNFNGWVLDFDNDANNEQIGKWASSRNLVLTRPRDNGAIPDGAKWLRR